MFPPNKLRLYCADPFEFIVQHGGKAVSPSGGASHFVMLDAASGHRLDELLATNHHIGEVHVAHSSLVASQEHDRKMQKELASKFKCSSSDSRSSGSGNRHA
jgi:hypothetical protein